MGYGLGFPTYQVGNKKNLWDIREYGLSELWVKRESTVVSKLADSQNPCPDSRTGCVSLAVPE